MKPRINTRRKGSAFEYKVRDNLKKAGCFVTRSTVSKFPDLLAITEAGDVLFVECKSRKGALSKSEKQKMKIAKDKYGITPIVAYPRYSVYSKKKDNLCLDEVK